MTVEAKNRRIQAVKLADALNAIEGVPVSSYAKMLSQCWENGELTGEQMKNALLLSHRRMADNSLNQPNRETYAALFESVQIANDPNVTGCRDMDELFAELAK